MTGMILPMMWWKGRRQLLPALAWEKQTHSGRLWCMWGLAPLQMYTLNTSCPELAILQPVAGNHISRGQKHLKKPSKARLLTLCRQGVPESWYRKEELSNILILEIVFSNKISMTDRYQLRHRVMQWLCIGLTHRQTLWIMQSAHQVVGVIVFLHVLLNNDE